MRKLSPHKESTNKRGVRAGYFGLEPPLKDHTTRFEIMPTFYIEQFGCRATKADGAPLKVQFEHRVYQGAAKESVDIVVENTCTVTSAADAQARPAIRKISAQNH